MTGQLDITTALRTECVIFKDQPCTYYVTSQLKEREYGVYCTSKCCRGCEDKMLCGYACNQAEKG